MKTFGTHYDDYINFSMDISLQPKINKNLKCLPVNITKLKNLIFYGPSGVGKYTQVLLGIKKYSPSSLKYEKKIGVIFNKETYYYKISDIHYEIDMSLLGCNSKLLWHDIFQQIMDIINSKSYKSGIIVCKYFNEIQPELLENFYSYMQKEKFSAIDIKFILITEQLSFIPENILNCCEIVHFSKPPKNTLIDINKSKTLLEDEMKKNNVLNFFNDNDNSCIKHYNIICNKIINEINNFSKINFLKFRDYIYDIFIYNLDINVCVWNILKSLLQTNSLTDNKLSQIMVKTYRFLKFYQNNYRPISHTESYFLFLANAIKENVSIVL